MLDKGLGTQEIDRWYCVFFALSSPSKMMGREQRFLSAYLDDLFPVLVLMLASDSEFLLVGIGF